MFAGCGVGPHHISHAEYDATQKAVTALQRAFDYRDEARVFYDPRLLDAQKVIEDIPGSDPAGAGTCLYALESYQSLLSIVRMDANAINEGHSWMVGATATTPKRSQRQNRLEPGNS